LIEFFLNVENKIKYYISEAIISASNEEEVAFVRTLPNLQEKYKGV
jgi:hypothetical protein